LTKKKFKKYRYNIINRKFYRLENSFSNIKFTKVNVPFFLPPLVIVSVRGKQYGLGFMLKFTKLGYEENSYERKERMRI